VWRRKEKWHLKPSGLHISNSGSHWVRPCIEGCSKRPRVALKSLGSTGLGLVAQFLEVPEAAEGSLVTQGPFTAAPCSPCGPPDCDECEDTAWCLVARFPDDDGDENIDPSAGILLTGSQEPQGAQAELPLPKTESHLPETPAGNPHPTHFCCPASRVFAAVARPAPCSPHSHGSGE
jgi:hypothetical protein